MIGKLTRVLKQYTASYLQSGPHDACLLRQLMMPFDSNGATFLRINFCIGPS
jgi:hypothetical protein